MINTKEKSEGIDMEWMQLILSAKNMGIDKEEIREFFQNSGLMNASEENR